MSFVFSCGFTQPTISFRSALDILPHRMHPQCHCWQGVKRASTAFALAYAYLCVDQSHGNETARFQILNLYVIYSTIGVSAAKVCPPLPT